MVIAIMLVRIPIAVNMLDDLIILDTSTKLIAVEHEPLPDGFMLSDAYPYCWLDTSGPIESIHSWCVSIDWPGKDFPAMGFGATPEKATEDAYDYALDLLDPEYREARKNWRPESLGDPKPTPPPRIVDPTSSAEAKRRLRKSKEAERTVGRWLLEHDGSDPRMKGIASSTGRTGHVTNMQIDVMSITYACEVKNIRVWASLWKFWNKIVDRATEHGKEPLLVIIPTNVPLGLKKFVPAMHIMTETRHASLLAAEKELHDMKSTLAKETE